MPAGSPVIFGNTDAAANSRGRNKRLAIVPAGYSWATNPQQARWSEVAVCLEAHWAETREMGGAWGSAGGSYCIWRQHE